MAYEITPALLVIQEMLRDSNAFRAVDIINVTSPPPAGPYAAIKVGPVSVAAVTLGNVATAAIEVHTVTIEISYAPYMQNQQDRVTVASALASQVRSLLYADYTLTNTVRNIDIGGQHSSGIEVDFTDETTANTPQHVATITVPLIVDGV